MNERKEEKERGRNTKGCRDILSSNQRKYLYSPQTGIFEELCLLTMVKIKVIIYSVV